MNVTTALAVALMLLSAWRARREQPREDGGTWWWLLIPASILLWWPPIGFIADDFTLLNHAERWAPWNLMFDIHTAGGDGSWRPLANAFLGICERFLGRDPSYWYALGLFWHGVNAMLVWQLGRRLGLAERHAALAGVLYAVHGAQPEAAAWMAGVFDRISTFFVLAALLAFAARREWLAGLLTVLGIASKEPAYITPVLAALWLWHEGTLRNEWRRLTPPAAATVLLLAWRFWLFSGPGGYGGATNFSPLHAAVVLGWRVWGTLWFPVNWSRGPSFFRLAAVALMLAGGILWAWRARGGRTALVALGMLLVCCLLPMGLLPIGADLEKSRLLYLPLAGFAVLVASLRPSKAAWALILAANALMLTVNLTIWRDVGRMTQRTCAQPPASAEKLPRIVDGVYYLKFALKDCIEAPPR